MKQKVLALLTIAMITGTGIVLGASHGKISIASLACDCEPGIIYETSLPRSHPSNQCALQSQTQQTSWLQWAKGDSRSVSFHFLDLLELLSRHSDSSPPEDKARKPSTR